jgi:hypothetical protein
MPMLRQPEVFQDSLFVPIVISQLTDGSETTSVENSLGNIKMLTEILVIIIHVPVFS